jgi:hypothetical protein
VIVAIRDYPNGGSRVRRDNLTPDRAPKGYRLPTAKRVDPAVFDRLGFVLLGVDSKANVQQVYPSYASSKSF